ncbi:hypothetical protein KKG08_00675 [Patescibacteria group bacterium]|nr:hypothetical protein [Patescibacteria group bacterium]
MIYIVHGDDISKSRILIKNQQKKLDSDSRIELSITDTTPEQLTEKAHSNDLFGNPPFIVLDVTSMGRMNVDKFIEKIKLIPSETTLIILSDRNLPKTNAFIKSASALGAKENASELSPQSNIFRFIDALFYKQRSKTYNELSKLLEDQVSPFEIFPMILYGLRSIAAAKFNSPSFVKKSSFVKAKAQGQSKLYSKEDILRIFDELQKIDRGTKLGEYDPEMALNLAAEKIL